MSPLGKTRTNLVFGVGDPMAKLMFVGEALGRDEDLQGEPFVGRAGQLLTKIIEAISMKRSDVYIANVLKCRPPENRNPLPEEIVLCMPYLIKQIEIIQPKVLCALGTFAAQTLLSTKAPVGTLRGKFHEYKGIPMMVTYHPAYLLRNPNDKAKVWDDMKKVRDFWQVNYPEKTRKFKNSKEKNNLTNAMWVNNNAPIKHEDRFFSQIQFIVVLSWLTFYLFHIIFQLKYEGLIIIEKAP